MAIHTCLVTYIYISCDVYICPTKFSGVGFCPTKFKLCPTRIKSDRTIAALESGLNSCDTTPFLTKQNILCIIDYIPIKQSHFRRMPRYLPYSWQS
jgi:hypothetical protein